MEDNVIFKGKFSLSLHLFFFNLNQPHDPRNYVPTNVPIFMNPRKLSPTKINDFTVYKSLRKFFGMYSGRITPDVTNIFGYSRCSVMCAEIAISQIPYKFVLS